MKINNPKINKTINLGSETYMSVEITETLVEQIKKEYDITEIEDVHIQAFFRDVLHDASLNISKDG